MASSLFTGLASVVVLLSQIFGPADYPFEVIFISTLSLTSVGSIITLNAVVFQHADNIASSFNGIVKLATKLGKFLSNFSWNQALFINSY